MMEASNKDVVQYVDQSKCASMDNGEALSSLDRLNV